MTYFNIPGLRKASFLIFVIYKKQMEKTSGQWFLHCPITLTLSNKMLSSCWFELASWVSPREVPLRWKIGAFAIWREMLALLRKIQLHRVCWDSIIFLSSLCSPFTKVLPHIPPGIIKEKDVCSCRRGTMNISRRWKGRMTLNFDVDHLEILEILVWGIFWAILWQVV